MRKGAKGSVDIHKLTWYSPDNSEWFAEVVPPAGTGHIDTTHRLRVVAALEGKGLNSL